MGVTLSLLVSGLIAAVIDRLAIRPVMGAGLFSAVIMTLGINIALNNTVGIIWGHSVLNPKPIFPREPLNLGGLVVSYESLAVIGVGFVIALLMYLLFRYTQTGHKMIAVSQDQTLPLYYGISVKGVFGLTWALAGIVGGFGGILLTSANYLAPVVMGNFIFKGFTAAVIGGLNSVPGVFVGGFILGIVENLVAGYVSVEWTDVIASVMIFATLSICPQGLFGAVQQRRV